MGIEIYMYIWGVLLYMYWGGYIWGLLVFDAGHKEVYVVLYICGEVFHELELWPGCHIDAKVYLQVQVFGALEGVVFISYGGSFAKSAGSLFSGCLGVSA